MVDSRTSSQEKSLSSSRNLQASNFMDSHYVYQQFLYTIKKDASVQRKEEGIKINYNYDLQLAHYSNLKPIEALGLFDVVGETVDNQQIVFFYAYKLPEENAMLEKAYLYLIDRLDGIIEKGYLLVFFNTGVSNFDQSHFAFLRNCYQKLPLKYLMNLNKIYIVHPSLILKSFVLFSTSFQSKIIDEKTVYVENIKALKQEPFFKFEYLKKIPQSLLEKDDSAFARAGFIGCNINDFSLGDAGLPELLICLIYYFEILSDKLNSQGIFRVAASASEQDKVEKMIKDLNYEEIFQVKDANIIAGLIKKFFTAMPEPLFLFKNYEDFTKVAHLTSAEKKIAELRRLMKSLPPLNYKTLVFMIDFIHKIASRKEKNNMPSYNLAVVFTPCFIRPTKYTERDLLITTKLVDCFKLLVDSSNLILNQKMEVYEYEDEEEEEQIDENLFKSQFHPKKETPLSKSQMNTPKKEKGGGDLPVKSERSVSYSQESFHAFGSFKPEDLKPKANKKGFWGKIKDLFD